MPQDQRARSDATSITELSARPYEGNEADQHSGSRAGTAVDETDTAIPVRLRHDDVLDASMVRRPLPDQDTASCTKGRTARGQRKGAKQQMQCDKQVTEDALIQRVPPQLSVMSSATAQQVQMLSSFLEVHFPSRAAKADLATRGSYLMGLPDVDLTNSPVLRHALDTVCFAHVGSKFRDDRLRHESQQAYGKVLSVLAHDLERPRPRNKPRHILASIMLLCLYDDSIPSPRSQVSGWTAHYHGAAEFLKALGPSRVDMSHAFDRLMFNNLRMPSIYLGIARRKAAILSERKWLALAESAPHALPSRVKLYSLALQIPGLLERVEECVSSSSKDKSEAEQQERVVHAIHKSQSQLRQWIHYISPHAHKFATLNAHTVHRTDPDAFDTEMEEQCFMTTNPTFSSFYDLRVFQTVEDCTLYWQFSLILDCALLRLLHYHPTTAATYLVGRSPADVSRSAFDHASNLCRAVLGNSRCYGDSQGQASHIDCFVGLAQNFFGEVGATREVGWCQGLRLALRLRLGRLRSTQPRTLCRMGDIADHVAAVALFKARRQPAET